MRTFRIISPAVLLIFLSVNIHYAEAQAPGVTGSHDSPFIKYPWAGGLNSCQFGQIDINLDGIPDLVIFDRHGNRILPFINKGTSGMTDYELHSELASLFPDLHDWVIFADYNCDGRQDIFTYSSGGIRVFSNVSTSVLQFRLVTNLLQSFYYTGDVGILVTPSDYPAVADIDNDGDLDLLTFFGLGSYIEYHKNLSVETFGNCDSLDYRLTDKCWGDIKESEGSNYLTLNITCPYKSAPFPSASCNDGGSRHTGSTFLVTDLNGDGVKDLVLGDVDFPDLISLINGGTTDSGHMISQDTLFPSSSKPVNLFSFPAMGFLDLDNDNVKDLVVSPFDPAYSISENYRSVWFYKNTGSDSIPDFQFVNDRFFQDEMIDDGSNSFPVLFDIDGDGLPDLFTGDYGYYDSSWYFQGVLHSSYTSRISYFKNTGTLSNPEFTLITDDFAGLSSQHLTGIYPTFGDVDGDGDPDLIIGNSDGTLIYLQNTGSRQSPVFAGQVYKYQDIDVGDFSAPQLFDLDNDGRYDLIIGEQKGNLNYFHNDGTVNNPLFRLVTDSLGKINVTDYNLFYDGFSTPFFFRDKSNKIKLISGSQQGTVFYYTGIENNLTGKFNPSDSLFALITDAPFSVQCGIRTAACIGTLSDPLYMDLIVGNWSGGLNYFSHKSIPPSVQGFRSPDSKDPEIRIYPNPSDKEFQISVGGPQSFPKLTIILVNSLGQEVLMRTISHQNSTTVNTASFPAGLYILHVYSTDNTSSAVYSSAKVLIRH
jgi:hypothetical protein